MKNTYVKPLNLSLSLLNAVKLHSTYNHSTIIQVRFVYFAYYFCDVRKKFPKIAAECSKVRHNLTAPTTPLVSQMYGTTYTSSSGGGGCLKKEITTKKEVLRRDHNPSLAMASLRRRHAPYW